MKRYLILSVFLISCNILLAQVDREFWFAIPKETSSHGVINATYTVSFKISAMNLDANVTISMPANPYFTPRNFLVPAGTSHIEVMATNWVQFDSIYANPARWNAVAASGKTLHGILITADNDITVYYDYDNQWNRDLFSLKGKNALGTEFFTPFQNIWSNGNYALRPYSDISIVATEDGTVVDIYPTQQVQGYSWPLPTGTIQVTLNRGETFTLRANGYTGPSHLSGTRIVSNKKIAVTTNDDSVQETGAGCRDILGDQLVPTDIIGSKYLVMSGYEADKLAGIQTIPPPPQYSSLVGEQIFVTATKPGTTIHFKNRAGTTVYSTTLGAGGSDYMTIDIDDPLMSSIYVYSDNDKPFYVFHITGITCELGGAILPPITDCTGSNEVTVFPGITGANADGSDSKITVNIMIPYDKTKLFTDTTQSHYHFTLYNSKYPGGYRIPGTFFEPDTTAGWAVLKFNDRNFGPAGTNAKNLMVFGANKFVNTEDYFHFGMTNGSNGRTNKYGYFSSFNKATAEVRIKSTEEQDYIGCYGESITLVAAGGLEYTWHYGKPDGPPLYLSDPKSPTPELDRTIPVGSHNFYVEIRQSKCLGTDTLKVFVNILPVVTADFEVDKASICAIDTVTFTNKSVNGSVFYWKTQVGSGPVNDLTINPPGTVMSFREVLDNPSNIAPLYINYTLITESLQGCSDTKTKTIEVRPKIQAEFEADDTIGCNPLPVQFTNLSSGNIDSCLYIWTFGDQGSTFDTNPAHIYTNYSMQDTTYIVQLITKTKYYCTDTFRRGITVHPFIEAYFATDTVKGCSPLNIQIQNNSLGAISRYTWNYGTAPGDTSNVSLATHNRVYTNTTGGNLTHKLLLSVFNAAGCMDSMSRFITVYPEILTQFTANPTEGCNPIHVTFTNNSNPAANSFYWDFGDGANSVDPNPSHDFVNLGLNDTSFTVILRATTSELCPGYDTAVITVRGDLDANFTIDSSAFCTPYNLRINNISRGSTSTVYTWSFGDGTPDSVTTSKNPIWHTYTLTGGFQDTVTISLRAEGSGNCIKNVSKQVTLYPEVFDDFSPDVIAGCTPLTVNFTNNSSSFGGTTYYWDFGDTTSTTIQHPQHIFTNLSPVDRNYDVSLIVRNQFNCADTVTQTITVYSYIEAGFTVNNAVGCSPLPVTVTDASRGGIASRLWTTNFGQTSYTSTFNIIPVRNTLTYVDSARYIRLTISNSHGCQSIVTRPLVIYPEIDAQIFFSPIVSNCQPKEVNFMNVSIPGITDHLMWDFGDGAYSDNSTVTHQFTNLTKNEVTYNTRLYVFTEYNCTDTAEIPITVYPFLETVFGIDMAKGCSPHTVTFTNASLPISGANGYTWYFGEGNSLPTNSPTVTYTYNNPDPMPRQFNVILTGNYNNQCFKDESHIIEVYPLVTANFYPGDTAGCHPLLNKQFIDLSNNETRWDWDFGDRGTSVEEHPTHTFTNYGISDSVYTVRLTATSDYNCSAVRTQNITVYPKPKARFQVDNSVNCPPFEVPMANKSEAGDFFNWEFGDGASFNNTTMDTVRHIYDNLTSGIATYPLVLTVQTVHGCSDTTSQFINVYPRVHAQFNSDSVGCSPYLVAFNNNSIRATQYFWDFGDNSTVNVETPTHRFFNSSVNDTSYTVTLIVKSDFECSDTVSHNILVHPQPIASFQAKPTHLYFPDAITTLENNTNPGYWTYYWNFGDGSDTTVRDPGFHEYSRWGYYNIMLTVRSPYCADSTMQRIRVFRPAPIPDFTVTNDRACVPIVVSFENRSQWTDSCQFLWEFDDGSKSTERDPGSHFYNTAGRYQAKLTVTCEEASAYTYKDVYVWPKPKVDFSVAPTLVMLPKADVKMSNKTEGATRYLWEFGDGEESGELSPLHTYSEVGYYTITLNAWTEHNCFDSIVKFEIVRVIAPGLCEFPNAFIPRTTGPSDGTYNMESNDIFHPYWEGVDKYHLEIYTRWGVKLFESNDVNIGWDGYFEGKLCKADVYVYTAKGTYLDGSQFKRVGDVTLIR
jgi:PKD repeat protein